MAINLDQIKDRLKQIQQTASSGGGSDFLWKPPVGKSQIRIVPYAFNKDNPFQELYFHFEVGKKTLLSPSSFGRPDPIIDFSDKLKRTGNKDDWKLGRKIEPKFRVYAPIIIRGQEEEGVKFWSFGKQIYQELLGIISDPDYGDITDLMNGRDITIEHTPAEKDGAFPTFSVRVKPNTTPATNDKDIAAKIVSNQKNISDIIKEPTFEELQQALENWLNPENVQTNTKGASPAKNSNTAKVEDIQSAFDSLFDPKE
jgi:hypothetical protein